MRQELKLQIGTYTEVQGSSALRDYLFSQKEKSEVSHLARELLDREEDEKVPVFGVSQVEVALRFKEFSMQTFCGATYVKAEVARRFSIPESMGEGFILDSTDPDLFFLVLTHTTVQSKLLQGLTPPQPSLELVRGRLAEHVENKDTSECCHLWIPRFLKRSRVHVDSPTLLRMNAGVGLDENSGVSEGFLWTEVDLDYPLFVDGVSTAYHRDDVLLGRDFEFLLFSRTLYAAVGLPLFQTPVSQLDFLGASS